MMARFTNQAERALELATEAAREFQHGYVGTEHILLGLIREGNGIAAKVLEQEGITDEQVTMMIQKLEMEGWPYDGSTGLDPEEQENYQQ